MNGWSADGLDCLRCGYGMRIFDSTMTPEQGAGWAAQIRALHDRLRHGPRGGRDYMRPHVVATCNRTEGVVTHWPSRGRMLDHAAAELGLASRLSFFILARLVPRRRYAAPTVHNHGGGRTELCACPGDPRPCRYVENVEDREAICNCCDTCYGECCQAPY